MKSHEFWRRFPAVLGAIGVTGMVHAQIFISFTSMTDYSNGSASPTHLLFSYVSVSGIPDTSNIVLSSPTGQFLSQQEFSNPSHNFSSSVNFTEYGTFLGEMGFAGSEAEWNTAGNPALPQWTLTLNQGLPTERQYQFGLTVNDLSPNPPPAFDVTQPAPGANTGPSVTLEWTAIPGAETTYVGVYPVPTGPGDSQSTSLPGGTTSWTPPQSLKPGQNYLWVNQTRTVSNPPSVIGFNQTSGDLADLPSVSLYAVDSSYLSRGFVAVPEPEEWAGLSAIALVGWAAWRGRARSKRPV